MMLPRKPKAIVIMICNLTINSILATFWHLSYRNIFLHCHFILSSVATKLKVNCLNDLLSSAVVISLRYIYCTILYTLFWNCFPREVTITQACGVVSVESHWKTCLK